MSRGNSMDVEVAVDVYCPACGCCDEQTLPSDGEWVQPQCIKHPDQRLDFRLEGLRFYARGFGFPQDAAPMPLKPKT